MKKMNYIRMSISFTPEQKAKLDELQRNGYTAAGLIRRLLDREFKLDGKPKKKRGKEAI